MIFHQSQLLLYFYVYLAVTLLSRGNAGTVLDFKDKTITIDSILLPMRNIVNLQLKPSVTRALRHNTCQAQEWGLHSRISRHKIKKTRKSSTYATIRKAESTNKPLSRPPPNHRFPISTHCSEGQTTAQICLLTGRSSSFRWQSRLHHDSHEVIAGK